jgi:hypothetical protein
MPFDGFPTRPVRVTVVDRFAMAQARVHDRVDVILRRVQIAPTCPCCGAPRGTPRAGRFQELNGEAYWASVWQNPCGHRDLPPAVLREARVYAGHEKVTNPLAESVCGRSQIDF